MRFTDQQHPRKSFLVPKCCETFEKQRNMGASGSQDCWELDETDFQIGGVFEVNWLWPQSYDTCWFAKETFAACLIITSCLSWAAELQERTNSLHEQMQRLQPLVTFFFKRASLIKRWSREVNFISAMLIVNVELSTVYAQTWTLKVANGQTEDGGAGAKSRFQCLRQQNQGGQHHMDPWWPMRW